MIKQQQALDNVTTIQMTSFKLGTVESKLAAYLGPGLALTLRKMRITLTQQAAKSAGLDGSAAGILRLLAEGPEDDRQELIDCPKVVEQDPTGLKVLN